MIISIVEESLKKILKVGFILTENLVIRESSAELRTYIEELAKELKEKYSSSSPSSIKELESARTLYKRAGIDPTKDRPSSEALLRRAIKGEFPFINSLVDTINFCSLKFLIPYGLYDFDKIKNKIEIMKGGKEDFYESIGKGRINLKGKITVFDEVGPFGNPSSDSKRTSCGKDTKTALTIIFLNSETQDSAAETIINFTESMISLFHPDSRTVKLGIIT